MTEEVVVRETKFKFVRDENKWQCSICNTFFEPIPIIERMKRCPVCSHNIVTWIKDDL